jgi:hypothetical protein
MPNRIKTMRYSLFSFFSPGPEYRMAGSLPRQKGCCLAKAWFLQFLNGNDDHSSTPATVQGSRILAIRQKMVEKSPPKRVCLMRPVLKALGIILFIGSLIGGAGCGHWQYDQFPAPSWNPPGLATPRIDSQNQVFVHPGTLNLRLSRVGLLTFRATPDFSEVGPALTQIFYRELLAKRPFAEIVLIPETYTTKEEALRLAKRYQLDLMVLGEIPYFLDGGTVGNSGLQVDLKVVEAENGRLLWSLTDSLKATRRPIIDLWVVETRPYPTPQMGALAARLAARLAETLEQGPPPPPPTGITAWFNGG